CANAGIAAAGPEYW
nr:immunoglobulin heavy chain junction region [Macaca mulatta]